MVDRTDLCKEENLTIIIAKRIIYDTYVGKEVPIRIQEIVQKTGEIHVINGGKSPTDAICRARVRNALSALREKGKAERFTGDTWRILP